MATVLFQLVNLIAMFGWFILIGFPSWKNTTKVIVNGVILILCLFYLSLICIWISRGAKGGFDTLDHVKLIFADDLALTAGWIHYLAFDLFVGLWVTQDAQKISVQRWLLIPIQFMTFMLGPIGFFSYMILRRKITKESVSQL